MINIDALTLKLFAEENSDYFEDARIQKIQQPTRRDLIIQLHSAGDTRKLYININPSCYHVCFLSKESTERRHIEIPNQPPMFCMLLRKYMVGSRIVRVNVPEGERILEIYFETFSEIGEIIPLCLTIELMGKHSNVVLYNYDTNIILGCMHNIGAEKSREREMAGGLPYIYPPKQIKENLKNASEKVLNAQIELNKDKLDEFFPNHYKYISKALMQEIEKNGNIKECLQKTAALKDFNPSIARDYKDFSVFTFNKDERIFKSSVNEMIDDYFSFYMEKNVINNLRQSLIAITNKELKKHTSTLEKQQKQAEKINTALSHKQKADIIMANLYQLKSQTKKVTLNDFVTGEPVEIELDELISPVENANKYYKLYNKAKTAYEMASEMMKKTEELVEYWQNVSYQIENTDNYSDLAEIQEEISPSKEKTKKHKEIIVQEENINGFRIFIGKNNKQNDYIFSKISAPDDIWFHALNSPGSHVLVKITDKKELDDNTLLKTAQIAKKFSKQANSLKASIIYTKRRYLKRPPNTHAGYVTYKNEQEIVVE